MIDLINILARAGGGGSSGGGGGAIGIIVLPFILLGYYLSSRKRKKQLKAAKLRQELAVSADPQWDDSFIKNRVSEVFYAFQADWSSFNTVSMGSYLTPDFHRHMSLVLLALWNMKRRNIMSNVGIDSIALLNVGDSLDNNQDKFAVEISAHGTDMLIDTSTGQTIHTGESQFNEVWHFKRSGNTWNLDSITQITYDGGLVSVIQFEPVIDKKYASFAEQNQFYYNADFGWLLLPFKGALFSRSNFGTSNIDHHIIGMYHDIVVQFFEYTPWVSQKVPAIDYLKHFYKRRRNPLSTYTICHTVLPRAYGNILVEPHAMFGFAPNTSESLRQVSLEWPSFNKRYDVYATNKEQATSLELLHPAFMEKLVALPFKVGIQVVGSDLYFYTTDKKAEYNTMLELLRAAFKEMKM